MSAKAVLDLFIDNLPNPRYGGVMTIQWFPGHMAKARRELEERLPKLDIVVELLDARLPFSSRNPMIDDLIAKKKRMIVLTKADLADPAITSQWETHFKDRGIATIALDIKSGTNVSRITKMCKDIVLDTEQAKARIKSIAVGIVGIPNVGKSSLINALVKRRRANVEDRPAVTKRQQWIALEHDVILLDTPGILWPRFEDEEVGFRLALVGTIKEELLDLEEVSLYLCEFLSAYYPTIIKKRYELEEIPKEPEVLLELIGKKRGCLGQRGVIDIEKTTRMLIRDLRAGKLGRVTFETPGSLR